MDGIADCWSSLPMEIPFRPEEGEKSSITNSPTSLVTSSNNSNGGLVQIQSPKPVSRSEPNPYPTTFVQVDTTTFKQVVQMLTGSAGPPLPPPPQSSLSPDAPSVPSKGTSIPAIRTGQKKQGFKLYERRNSLKNRLVISPLLPNCGPGGFSPRKAAAILSPSVLDFPSSALSPVTPLVEEDPFDKSSPSVGSSSEEERAIAEKGFYLHPSPRTTPRDPGPRLLPLFPVTSPRVFKLKNVEERSYVR